MPNDGKIRYAVVGAGWISQETVLPAFRNARNSELAALVTHDPDKARELSAAYNAGTAVPYSEYDTLLRGGTVDAV